MLFPIRKVFTFAMLFIVVLAIWRGSGEDAGNIAETIWGVISGGADILSEVWRTATD